MRIFYFTNTDLSLRRSHVYTILKTAEALGRESGEPVIVSAPSRGKALSGEAILSRHGVASEHVRVAVRQDGIRSSIRAIVGVTDTDIFFYRDPRLVCYAFVARLRGQHPFLEVHRMARSLWERSVWWVALRLARGVIFITEALARRFPGVRSKAMVVRGNTYEPALFVPFEHEEKEVLRKRLEIPRDKHVLVYAGNTLSYSFDNLFSALARLKDTVLVIVGATNEAVLQESAKRVGAEKQLIIRGRMNGRDVPSYLLSADVLVSPFVRDEPGAFPFKLFEYMGAGKPIVTYANESIREVLRDGENALLIADERPDEWVSALETLSEGALAERLATAAKHDAAHFTRAMRGKEIFTFLNSRL